MLEYENQMFLEILQEDGLVITAKGLGLETVFINILKVYCDPGNLVLVLGTNDDEESYFIEKLKDNEIKYLPRVVTAHCLSEERCTMYLEGGVLFISGRILVVDLLKGRVPTNLVTGIIIYRAHSILNSYQESFALRLYRKTNKNGFIKAFTDSALAFTIGFTKVEQVMKRLFLKKLYLWPRFHKTVIDSLSKYTPHVLELHVKLTPKMLNIQSALLDVMKYMVQELKKNNKYLDLDELTLENAVANKFHKQLQLQLDPIWDQLSFKTKQLLSDLKTQRSLLMCLTHEDCVSFYAMLNGLRTMEYAMQSSGWTVLDTIDEMFKNAKLRVYSENGDIRPEPNPKWLAILDTLTEIRRDKVKKNNDSVEKILILTQNNRSCNQLKNFLTMKEEYLLREVKKKLKPLKVQNTKKLKTNVISAVYEKMETATEAENDVDDNEDERESYVLTLSQNVVNVEEDDLKTNRDEISYEECSQLENLDLTTIITKEPILIIETIKKGGDSFSLHQTLERVLPSYIILYSADISAVRILEIYRNKYPAIPLTVYFLIYGGSVEEQAYLTSLRREKYAFDTLVIAQTTMVVPVEQDGKSSEPTCSNVEEENTRKGGLKEDQTQVINKIIVDMREFRSELPSLLHQRDMEIEPVTLLIGDYILSPDICVERKSISDLIGSLNSGRLYNQAVAMTRYYAKPMLLIEFDQNKPFGLQGNYYISKDMKSIDVTHKLQLFTIHFPKLKLVWSPSPHATAQLFEELKQGRLQPDATIAMQVGMDDNIDESNTFIDKYNCHIQDLIAKLPGVNSKNLRLILNNGQSLDHLISLTKKELSDMISNESNAELLYHALHNKHQQQQSASSSKAGTSKFKNRNLFYKNN